MPNLVSVKGYNNYQDSSANQMLLHYALDSPYCEEIYFDALVLGGNADLISAQFALAQSIRPDTELKLHHFILGFDDDISMFHTQKDAVINSVLGYFLKRNFQAVIAYHSGSKKRRFYPHFHVIVNHVSIDGGVFYGTDTQYGEVLNALRQATQSRWNLCWRSDIDE